MDETYTNDSELLTEEDEEKKKKGKLLAILLIAMVLLAAGVEAVMYLSKEAGRRSVTPESAAGALAKDVEKIVAQYMTDTYGEGLISTEDMGNLSSLVAEKLISDGGTDTISLVSTETIERMVSEAIREYEEGMDGEDGTDGRDGREGTRGADGDDGADGLDGKPAQFTEEDKRALTEAISATVAADMAQKLSSAGYITGDQLTEYSQYVYSKVAELEKTVASNYSAYQNTVNSMSEMSSKLASLSDAMSKREDELAGLRAEVRNMTGNNSSVQSVINREIADRKAADDAILKELSEKLNSATALTNAALNELMSKNTRVSEDMEDIRESMKETGDILSAVQSSLTGEAEERKDADRRLAALIGSNSEELSDSINTMRSNFSSNLRSIHNLIDGLSSKEAAANAELLAKIRATESEAEKNLKEAREELGAAMNAGDSEAAANALSRYIELSSTLTDSLATLYGKIRSESEETRSDLEARIYALSTEYNTNLENIYGIYRTLSKSLTERMDTETALREKADAEIKEMIAGASDISDSLESRLNDALAKDRAAIQENTSGIRANSESIAGLKASIEESSRTTNNYITEIRNELAEGTHVYAVTESEYSSSGPLDDSGIYMVCPD